MTHIKVSESAGLLFRIMTWDECRSRVGHLHLPVGEIEVSRDAQRWISALDDSMYSHHGWWCCNRKGVLDPVTPRQVEHLVGLIGRSHSELVFKSVILKPYGIPVHNNSTIDAYLELSLEVWGENRDMMSFTFGGLLDVEVFGFLMKNSKGRHVWVYFLSDDYILASSFGWYLWCDGMTGLLQGLDSVLWSQQCSLTL